MNILSVSTSSRAASAAVTADGVCVTELVANTDRKHAETLMPLIDSVLHEAGVALSDIDLFAVDVGPGSFTGVRIGVSAVNAMAAALGKLIVPVDALRALYEAAPSCAGPVCTMIDAGNGNAYAALYEQGRTLLPPDAVETAAYLEALPVGTAIVGDTDGGTAVPAASAVGAAAFGMTGQAQKAVTPLYLRVSQAERLRAQRQTEAQHE